MIKDHLCFKKYARLEFLSDVPRDNSSRQHYIMRCVRPLATWQIWSCEYTKAYTRFFPLVAILISMSLATWRCWLAGGHFVLQAFWLSRSFEFLDSKEADQEQLGVLVEMTETIHHLDGEQLRKGNHHSQGAQILRTLPDLQKTRIDAVVRFRSRLKDVAWRLTT